MSQMDDIQKLIARKIFEVLRTQESGDIEELRRLAKQARERGYHELADHAEAMAYVFAVEDNR